MCSLASNYLECFQQKLVFSGVQGTFHPIPTSPWKDHKSLSIRENICLRPRNDYGTGEVGHAGTFQLRSARAAVLRHTVPKAVGFDSCGTQPKISEIN